MPIISEAFAKWRRAQVLIPSFLGPSRTTTYSSKCITQYVPSIPRSPLDSADDNPHVLQAHTRMPFLKRFRNDWVTSHILVKYFAGIRYVSDHQDLEEDLEVQRRRARLAGKDGAGKDGSEDGEGEDGSEDGAGEDGSEDGEGEDGSEAGDDAE